MNNRFITLKVDMDAVAKLVRDSARTCFKAHNISLPEEYLQEVWNNVAAVIVGVGDQELNVDRLELWAHIVSEHCNAAPPGSVVDMLDYHESEHEGPGTIRNHDPHSYHYSLRKLAAVLSELEPEDSDS